MRVLAFGVVPALAVDGWAMSFLVVGLGVAAGLTLERTASNVSKGTSSLLAASALLTSLSSGGIDGRSVLSLALLLAGALLASQLTRAFLGVWPRATIGFVAVLAAAFWESASGVRAAHPFTFASNLFGGSGLLYNTPILWLGFAGLMALRRDRSDLFRVWGVGVLAGLMTQTLPTPDGTPRATSMIWIAFLAPGIACTFDRLQGFALRRAEHVVAVAAVLLVVWNLLFMEQYRRRFLPSDETVSFSRVSANNAALLSQFVGTPMAWPANWLAAHLLDIPLQAWDAASSRDIFRGNDARNATIEFGDDPTILAPDKALMLEGFRTRRTCGSGWCRDLDERGRIVFPIRAASSDPFTIALRVRGEGTLSASLDGAATRVRELGEEFVDFTLVVPGSALPPGLHIVSLQTTGRATIDRISFSRTTSRD